MKIEKDFRNDLLKRREILFSLEEKSNPGFSKMQEHCANHFKIEPERVVIKRVFSNFGSHEFFAEALIYDSIEDKINTEPKAKAKKEAKK